MRLTYYTLNLVLFTILIVFSNNISAQDKPYWVVHETVENPEQYYFGVGVSSRSKEEADNDAYVNFSKMIEVKVQSMTEIFIEENQDIIKDGMINKSRIESDVKLKGVSITARFRDEQAGIFYSLIKYERSAYEEMVKRGIEQEVEELKAKYSAEEQKKQEELRHSAEMAKLKENETREKMEREKREEYLEEQKKQRRIERERFITEHYKTFIDTPVPAFLIDIQNAELEQKKHEVILKPTVYPLSFIQANYNFYGKYLGFALGFYWQDKKLQCQDAQIKLRLFKDRYDAYPIALAIGLVQYSYHLSNFSDVNSIRGSVTPALYANVSLPQLANHISLFVDRRKLSISIQYFPFFEYFKGKLSMLAQNDLVFLKAFRNRFNNNFIVQPGLGFEVIPNSFQLMFSYEDNEFVTMTINLKI